jgi:hypothetical protein
MIEIIMIILKMSRPPLVSALVLAPARAQIGSGPSPIYGWLPGASPRCGHVRKGSFWRLKTCGGGPFDVRRHRFCPPLPPSPGPGARSSRRREALSGRDDGAERFEKGRGLAPLSKAWPCQPETDLPPTPHRPGPAPRAPPGSRRTRRIVHSWNVFCECAKT